jgi:hypothetical protein
MTKVIDLPNGGRFIEHSDGDKEWFLNDKLHREDGYAAEYANGGKVWYINGKLHREDGPALDIPNRKEWWVNGERLPCTTQVQFERLMRLKAFW